MLTERQTELIAAVTEKPRKTHIAYKATRKELDKLCGTRGHPGPLTKTIPDRWGMPTRYMPRSV